MTERHNQMMQLLEDKSDQHTLALSEQTTHAQTSPVAHMPAMHLSSAQSHGADLWGDPTASGSTNNHHRSLLLVLLMSR